MISTTAEYAVRAMLLLAMRKDDTALRADEIADAIGAPRNYLSKTLRILAREGLVDGLRGPNGGFRLAVDPRTVTIASLVDLFDDTREGNGCLVVDCDCASTSPCAVHRWWNKVGAAGRDSLETTNIAQLVRSRATVSTAPRSARGKRGKRSSSTIPARRARR